MRIFLGNTELTGADVTLQVLDSEHSFERLVQIATGIDRRARKVTPQRNHVSRVEFELQKQHADEASAVDYYFYHPYDIPDSAVTVRLDFSNSGGPTRSLWFSNAAVQGGRGRVEGKATIFRYTLVLGAPSRTQPT